MIKSNSLLQHQSNLMARVFIIRGRAGQFLLAGSVLVILAQAVSATPVKDYHKRIRQAVTALESLAQSDENENASAYESRGAETLGSVGTLLPETEIVEWNGASYKVDNSWLHQELDKYGTVPNAERADLLKRVAEHLQAIDERLAEIEKPTSGTMGNKSEEERRLAEILQRPEYARKINQESALTRQINRFLKWIQDWLKDLLPNRALSSQFVRGELHSTDLESGSDQSLFSGFLVTQYDISPDSERSAFSAIDQQGHSHLWLAPLSLRSSPRKFISATDEDSPVFDASGHIYFRAIGGTANFLYRMSEDGKERTKALPGAILGLDSVSPDGNWVIVMREMQEDKDVSFGTQAVPVGGGDPSLSAEVFALLDGRRTRDFLSYIR